MRYTCAELLMKLLKRNNMSAYVSQRNGTLNWMWMGGENNSMILKGSCSIENLYTIRIAFREIREATILAWPQPKKVAQVYKPTITASKIQYSQFDNTDAHHTRYKTRTALPYHFLTHDTQKHMEATHSATQTL